MASSSIDVPADALPWRHEMERFDWRENQTNSWSWQSLIIGDRIMKNHGKLRVRGRQTMGEVNRKWGGGGFNNRKCYARTLSSNVWLHVYAHQWGASIQITARLSHSIVGSLFKILWNRICSADHYQTTKNDNWGTGVILWIFRLLVCVRPGRYM